MKKLSIILLCFLLLTGCKQNNVFMPVSETENTSLNIENGANFIKLGDTLYYSEINAENKYVIVAQKEEEKKEVVFTEHCVTLYDCYDGNLICKIGDNICMLDVDSGEITTLTETARASLIMVEGEYVFFVDELNLKKININTLEIETIDEHVLNSFDVSGNYIYYACFENEKNFIKKANIESISEKETIYEGAAKYITVQDDGIYFLNFNLLSNDIGDEKIYKITPEGSVENVGEHRVMSYNIYENTIYYANKDDNCFLYKMGMDGENPELVIEKETFFISIYEDELYFETRDEKEYRSCIYNIKTNEIRQRAF